MSKIRELNDPSILDAPLPVERKPSPRAIAAAKAHAALLDLMSKIVTPDDVYQIELEDGEKPLTVRQRILRAAKEADKNIVVRQIAGRGGKQGFAVGLWTPERATRRGRKPKAAVTA